MTFQASMPAITPLIPENAPFSLEQRAWLNGFFAGFIAPQAGSAQPISGDAAGVPAAAEEDDAPWHDPAMPLDERMGLAAGKPLTRRMMAAMAQQDCGQCGYNCQDYSKAIVVGEEARLNLCVPGGKETARKVKELAAEIGSAPAGDAKPAAAPAEAKDAAQEPTKEPTKVGYARGTPAEVTFLGRRRLNRASRRRRPITSTSTCGTPASTTSSATASACSPTTRPTSSTRCWRRSTSPMTSRWATSRSPPCWRRSARSAWRPTRCSS